MALSSYYVAYNGVRSSNVPVYPVNRPGLPTPQWRTTKVTIPGRDGDLFLTDGGLEDITISVTFDFHGPAASWGDSFRALKDWALSPDTTIYLKMRMLYFSDDTGYRYAVKRVTIATTERVAKTIGRATVNFTCEGWSYTQAGVTQVSVPASTPSITLTNPTTYDAYPVFAIQASATGTITFSFTRPDTSTGTFSIEATSGQQYRINTRLQTVTNAAGANRLSVTNGDLKEWTLQPGATTIGISGSYSSLLYYPLWRTL